jgi:soluble lytic murein transglycosylase-like protein
MISRRTMFSLTLALPLLACARAPIPRDPPALPALYPGETAQMRALIQKWAAIHDIPESLLHRVIQRESDYNAAARNGPYWGLMQVLPATARGMGFKGEAKDLLNPEVNLEFAGKYLKGAWLVSGGDEGAAVMWYARGYYYEAKRLGLLKETGLRT